MTKIPNPLSELRSSFSRWKIGSEPKATVGFRRPESEQPGPSQNGVAPLPTGPFEPSLAVGSVRLGPVLGWPRLRSKGPALIRRSGLGIAHRFAVQLQAIGVVDQAVQQGVGDGGVADGIMPLRDGVLAG